MRRQLQRAIHGEKCRSKPPVRQSLQRYIILPITVSTLPIRERRW
jgi:hypothetical protein